VKAGGALVDDEEMAEGKVELEMYIYYMREAGGWWVLVLMVFCILVMQSTLIGSEWWLGRWSTDSYTESDSYYLGWYAVWMSGMAVITAVRICIVYERGLVAATSLHDRILQRVLAATMGFLDATPVGRILNRFSRDTSLLDSTVCSMIDNMFTICGWCLASILAVAVITPPFAVALLPLLFSYYRSFKYYRDAARETNRLQSVNTSPLVTHFSEALSGMTTIRGFGRTAEFIADNRMLTDVCHRPLFSRESVRRWMDLRLELINAALQFSCCLSLVFCSDVLELQWVDATSAGLAMKQILGVGQVLGFVVVIASVVEQSMNSVERVRHFTTPVVPIESARGANRVGAAHRPRRPRAVAPPLGHRRRERNYLLMKYHQGRLDDRLARGYVCARPTWVFSSAWSSMAFLHGRAARALNRQNSLLKCPRRAGVSRRASPSVVY
jgi:ABC-type multidrug transport system fused ATPase/permease subunit